MYYFDNSATTPVNEEVLQTFLQVSNQYFANPSSLHLLGGQANQLLEGARKQVADLLGFQQGEVYFTSSGTEANNWILQGSLRWQPHLRPDAKTILISAIEHPSVYNQIGLLEKMGFTVKLIPVTPEGIIDIAALKLALDSSVYLISTMAVNNEVGAQQPLSQIANLLTPYPQIIWHVDAVQALPLMPQIKEEKRIDALTLSGHKFHSVRGTGILALRQRIQIAPLLFGGGQERGLRSSTENLASIVATAKALRLAMESLSFFETSAKSYRQQVITQFRQAGWTVFSEEVGVSWIICAALPPIPGEVLVHAFEEEGIILSTTSACSSRRNQSHATLLAMKVDENIAKSAIRVSMSSKTSSREVQGLTQAIKKVSHRFQHLK